MIQDLGNAIHGLGNSIYGLRNSIYGLGNPIHGLRNVIYDLRNAIHGLGNSIYGLGNFGKQKKVIRSGVTLFNSALFNLHVQSQRSEIPGLRRGGFERKSTSPVLPPVKPSVMKKKVVQYQIEEPCHESWEAMTPDSKGRFCNSCAKPVVDFTSMSDRQVLQFMSAATGSVCGRMTSRQLDRDFTQYEMQQGRSFNLRALVLGTAISTFSALNAYSQGEVKGKVAARIEEPVKMGEMAATPVTVITDSVFSGRIFDYMEDTTVAGAEVTIFDEAGNQLSTTLSNEAGKFELPLDVTQNPYRVVFRKEGLEEVVYFFSDFPSTRDVAISMYSETRIIMGLVAPSDRR